MGSVAERWDVKSGDGGSIAVWVEGEGPARQSINSIEDRLRDTAGLIDDHQHVACMDAPDCGAESVVALPAPADKEE
jgi:hypothetical protein